MSNLDDLYDIEWHRREARIKAERDARGRLDWARRHGFLTGMIQAFEIRLHRLPTPESDLLHLTLEQLEDRIRQLRTELWPSKPDSPPQ